MASDDLREALAALAHERWSDWMTTVFRHMHKNSEGLWTLEPEKARRWQRQMHTAYTSLPEDEKRSDRAEADSILLLLADYTKENA